MFNLIQYSLLAQALNLLLGSIITIQMLAYFPLADILLPANAL